MADPGRICAPLGHDVDTVQMDQRTGVDLEGWTNRVIRVVDDDFARLGDRVRIAQLLDLGDHPPLGADHVGETSRLAVAQVHGQNGALGAALVGRLARPIDAGVGDDEQRAGRDADHAARRIAVQHVGLDGIAVIALRAEHGDGVLAGLASATPSLGAALSGMLGLRQGALDRLAQALVLDALDLGHRLVGEGAGRQKPSHSRQSQGVPPKHQITFPALSAPVPAVVRGRRCVTIGNATSGRTPTLLKRGDWRPNDRQSCASARRRSNPAAPETCDV